MLKVLEIAIGEVGYLEKASNADLDSKTGNAGFANYTKFARDLDKLGDFYNGAKQGFPWCEVFVDWCMVKAYGQAMALTLLCQPKKSAGAGCTQSASYYKQKGQFYTSPKVGDQVFFTWGGEIEHTGLVYEIDRHNIYTVEGNTSDEDGLVANGGGVFCKHYALNSSVIYGYGRPNYNLVDDGTSGTPAPEPVPDTSCTIKPDTLRKGSEGDQVMALQALLIKRWGISCGIYGMDGDFGNDTLKAVNKFKGNHGLPQNGEVDAACWSALLGVS